MKNVDRSLLFISIVVPVYNGAAVIRDCVESLLALDYPKEKLEVFIVDNNSTDGSRAIVQQYQVTLLAEQTQGCGAAKNKGIKEAKGDIIAFTDADCVVDSHWLQEIARTFQDDEIDAAIGFAHGINKNIYAKFAQEGWEEFWFHKQADGYSVRRKGIDPRNCAIRKRVFEKCGYFNSAMVWCEDLELSIRLNRANCHIAFNPDMKVWHKNPTSLHDILEKGRKMMPFILRLLRDLPKGISWEDVPVPRSAFYGIATRDMGKATVACVIPILRTGRCVLLAMVRVALALQIQHPAVRKLFKVYKGMSYDIAILQAKLAGQEG